MLIGGAFPLRNDSHFFWAMEYRMFNPQLGENIGSVCAWSVNNQLFIAMVLLLYNYLRKGVFILNINYKYPYPN